MKRHLLGGALAVAALLALSTSAPAAEVAGARAQDQSCADTVTAMVANVGEIAASPAEVAGASFASYAPDLSLRDVGAVHAAIYASAEPVPASDERASNSDYDEPTADDVDRDTSRSRAGRSSGVT